MHLAQALFSFLFNTLKFTCHNISTNIIFRPIEIMIFSLPSNYMVASFNFLSFTLSEFSTFNSCSACIFIAFLLLPGMKDIPLWSRHYLSSPCPLFTCYFPSKYDMKLEQVFSELYWGCSFYFSQWKHYSVLRYRLKIKFSSKKGKKNPCTFKKRNNLTPEKIA